MTDDELIANAKACLELAQTMDGTSRSEALEDLQFGWGGKQWTEQEQLQRDLDGRPCLTNNNLPAIIRQVTNDVRQNQQSIHIHPSDSAASKEVAEIMEGLCRHIEYDSAADAAYDTAVNYAASIGFGYFRAVTEYCSEKSFDQDIKIKRVRNPFTVSTDPGAEEADGSDMRWAMISTKLPLDVFKRENPKSDPNKSYLPTAAGDNGWLEDKFVRIAEFYRVEEETATLVRLSDGSTRFADDKGPNPPGVVPTGETRTTTRRKVMWYKITGVEVLEKAELPFYWIPIFPVYGDETDIDGKTLRAGLIRYAKDPKRMENYWMTAATEEIALRTKTPFIGAMGQFENVEDDWNQANTRSFSYLEYNPVTIEGTLAPAPQRQNPADVPSGYIAMAGIARDTVKAVTGIYDASLGNRSNETSGVAITARQHQGDVVNFHISDNLSRAIRHLGRTIVSAIGKVYDTQRMLRLVGEAGDHKQVEVNQPETVVDEWGKAAQTIKNDLTVGTYDVIVSSGPAYNTLRQEAAAAMIEIGGKWPQLMEVAGDLVIRAMDWSGADGIATRIEKTLPPGLLEKDEEAEPNMVQTPKGPIPADQAGQMIGQMDQTLEAMQGEMEKLASGQAVKQMEVESRERIAQMDGEFKLELAKLQATATHDNTELKGVIDLILGKMDAQNAAMTAQNAASVSDSTPAPKEAAPPIDIAGVLGQLGQALNPPRTKRMAITAPSGAVYQGEVSDEPMAEPEPASNEPAGEIEPPTVGNGPE